MRRQSQVVHTTDNLPVQMEAERNRRKQILDTQAAVNVAEGHKQRAILESEGGARPETTSFHGN